MREEEDKKMNTATATLRPLKKACRGWPKSVSIQMSGNADLCYAQYSTDYEISTCKREKIRKNNSKERLKRILWFCSLKPVEKARFYDSGVTKTDMKSSRLKS